MAGLERSIDRLLAVGADCADATLFETATTNVSCRNGSVEDHESADSRVMSLSCMIGQRRAMGTTTRLDDDAVDKLIQRLVATARLLPNDPYAVLAPQDRLLQGRAARGEAPEVCPLTDDELIEWIIEAESAGLGVEGVSQSRGAYGSRSHTSFALATSEGFLGWYARNHFSLSCSMIASANGQMEADYDYFHGTDLERLRPPRAVGERAGARAVERLGGKKLKTGTMPVVFDSRVSGSLIGAFAEAISGTAVAAGSSFLRDALGTQVFGSDIEIIDDPLMPGGIGSRAFDGEGVESAPISVVEGGTLKSWLLDAGTAKQLRLDTTGNSSRAPGAPSSPSSSNFYMRGGSVDLQALIADVSYGLLVTNLIGQGINPVTGDFSRGASGMLIEHGEITTPVKEVTAAGNLLDMFAKCVPANDLEFIDLINAPSLRIDCMTVAGT